MPNLLPAAFLAPTPFAASPARRGANFTSPRALPRATPTWCPSSVAVLQLRSASLLACDQTRPLDKPLDKFHRGQQVSGTVRKLVRHGAWIDIGAARHGLLHVRDMSTNFVYHPSHVLSIGQTVTATIKYVDAARGKLALSLLRREEPAASGAPRRSLAELQEAPAGSTVEGTIVRVTNFGAYVDVGAVVDGFLHISELWGRRPRETLELLRFGQKVSVTIGAVEPERSHIQLVARSVNREKRAEGEVNTERPVVNAATVLERPDGCGSAHVGNGES